MRITVVKDTPIARESRHLPAGQYNLARLIQARSEGGVAFVPVRRMQVLAILDAEEVVFVDSAHPGFALIVWSRFNPRVRTSLEDPVPFEASFHRPDAEALQGRLQAELYSAMQAYAAKQRIDCSARVLEMPANGATAAD